MTHPSAEVSSLQAGTGGLLHQCAYWQSGWLHVGILHSGGLHWMAGNYIMSMALVVFILVMVSPGTVVVSKLSLHHWSLVCAECVRHMPLNTVIYLLLSLSLSFSPCVYFSPRRTLPRVLNFCMQTYIDTKR